MLRPIVRLIAALVLVGVVAQAAPAPNRVLQLDGTGSYVELPTALTDGLTNATVEGWVKWDTLGNWSRFFDFGLAWRTMAVSQDATTASLEFEIWPRQPDGSVARSARRVAARNVLRPGRWFHIAAVSGSQGMQLYLDGLRVAANPFQGSFTAIGGGARNLLGRNV